MEVIIPSMNKSTNSTTNTVRSDWLSSRRMSQPRFRNSNDVNGLLILALIISAVDLVVCDQPATTGENRQLHSLTQAAFQWSIASSQCARRSLSITSGSEPAYLKLPQQFAVTAFTARSISPMVSGC